MALLLSLTPCKGILSLPLSKMLEPILNFGKVGTLYTIQALVVKVSLVCILKKDTNAPSGIFQITNAGLISFQFHSKFNKCSSK